jgi:hypothetical protein
MLNFVELFALWTDQVRNDLQVGLDLVSGRRKFHSELRNLAVRRILISKVPGEVFHVDESIDDLVPSAIDQVSSTQEWMT